MKVHSNQVIEAKQTEATSDCCGTTNTPQNVKAEPCCDQPTDGSSCCDKSLSQEENSKTTGCC